MPPDSNPQILCQRPAWAHALIVVFKLNRSPFSKLRSKASAVSQALPGGQQQRWRQTPGGRQTPVEATQPVRCHVISCHVATPVAVGQHCGEERKNDSKRPPCLSFGKLLNIGHQWSQIKLRFTNDKRMIYGCELSSNHNISVHQ